MASAAADTSRGQPPIGMVEVRIKTPAARDGALQVTHSNRGAASKDAGLITAIEQSTAIFTVPVKILAVL